MAGNLIKQYLPNHSRYVYNIPYNQNNFLFREGTTEKIFEIVNKIEGKKSAGYDVSSYLIKRCIHFICKPLTHIINASLNTLNFVQISNMQILSLAIRKGIQICYTIIDPTVSLARIPKYLN